MDPGDPSPGLIFLIMKIKAGNYLSQLQQKLRTTLRRSITTSNSASSSCRTGARLLDKAIDLDKTTMTQIAAYRSGADPSNDGARNEIAKQIDSVGRSINLAFENYPDLKAHAEIADAMQQNAYLQKEITAARELYNDTVNVWNRDIYAWPTKMIVAARRGYTTRIPFTASAEIKAQARSVFF